MCVCVYYVGLCVCSKAINPVPISEPTSRYVDNGLIEKGAAEKARERERGGKREGRGERGERVGGRGKEKI